jgi:hypothetical protein
MDSAGNIINYKLYKTSSGGLDNTPGGDWSNAKKEEVVGGLITKSQMAGLKSELISRGLYDNMRTISASAKPNYGGLQSALGQ